MRQIWEILDAQKINQDLFQDMYIGAVHVAHSFMLLTPEEIIQRSEQVLNYLEAAIAKDPAQETVMARSKICDLIFVQVKVKQDAGQHDDAIQIYKGRLVPSRSLQMEVARRHEPEQADYLEINADLHTLLESLRAKKDFEEGMKVVS